MLQNLKSLFTQHLDSAIEEPRTGEHHFRMATAALLVEVMRADFEIDESERSAILAIVAETFSLTAQEAADLLGYSEDAADDAVSLYEFTRHINDHLPPERKREVIALLWKVAYADGNLDKYEDHLVRKVADLIHLPHREFIQTKLQAEAAATKPRS
ncbi:MAG: TerB family tellurite resistance protein [Gammaproteobacteria bacterium]|nr:TerB family tellurite resistance protein [Gammaproteobacteria bacterium]